MILPLRKKFAFLCVAALAGAAPAYATSFYAVLPLVSSTAQAAPGWQMSLVSTSMAPAWAGVPFAFEFASLLEFTGEDLPQEAQARWSVVEGELPSGLVLSEQGLLSGIPRVTTMTPGFITIEAVYRGQSARRVYQLPRVAAGVVELGGYRAWGDGTYAPDCKGYLYPQGAAYVYEGDTGDGVYRVAPAGVAPFDARCDMATAGGGWTVIQSRFDGSVDFYRGYADYVAGFGTAAGEHWLGLARIRALAGAGKELWIDMQKVSGENAYARYAGFSLRGADYELQVSTFVGGSAGESFYSFDQRSVGRGFSTFDHDVDDLATGNCATNYAGGWWFDKCHSSSLNGIYLPGGANGGDSRRSQGLNWRAWTGQTESLTKTEMKLR